jgi:manganese/zinc/iron transport system ATP- binding protein
MEEIQALRVEQLTVNYDKIPVLWDINFSVPTGKLVGIIGPNGAGKSTLLKALLGIVKPLSGRIEFLAQPYKKVRKSVAYVPQRCSVDWDFPITVFDVVLMGRYSKSGLFKRLKKADKEAVLRALTAVGLESFAHRQIGELSGGQQQRLFIARALLQESDVYLLDEPFAGVDITTEKVIISIFDDLRSKGKTLFVVHHDLNSVDQYFDWPVEEVFHKELLSKTYGGYFSFLDEAAKMAQKKNMGLN